MKYLVSLSLILVGIIHLLPLGGALGPETLRSLYGISFDEPNLEILMRHRAVLFGMLGTFLVISAFKPNFQLAAFIAGFLSVTSFLYLALAVGGYNEQIGRVFLADITALVGLLVGFATYVIVQRQAE